MPVPEDIRKVERPTNTIVQDSGKDGPKRYIVRERNGSRYIPGGNPQPINGKTVGYIIDHKYIPICEKTASSEPSMLSYGACALVKSVVDDILADLLQVYPANNAYSIMALAALKVTRPGISGSRMQSAYLRSFVSIFWPGASLSKNSVTSLYRNIGADGGKRESFFERRIDRVCDEDHIVIDGTLKQDTSEVNDLSAFSYKARLKGCEEISVIYAFDLEQMEPVCAQVFPGNSIDAVSYRSFIKDNGLRKGIIITDKGFPPNEIRDILAKSPLLHYLTPVKRNDKRIREFHLTEFDGVLTGINSKTVQYKKANVGPGIWMYAFRDSTLAAAEEQSYLSRAGEKNSYDNAKYDKKKETFGLIVFESDRDLKAKDAYLCYDERWKLELVFKAYKSDECLDHTSVQGDFSIYGSEFVNFISTLITCRIITKATKAGLFKEMTYRDMIEELNSAWRKTNSPEGTIPVTGDEYWVHTIPMVFEILESLGLSKPQEKPAPIKRGRRKKEITLSLDQLKTGTENNTALALPQQTNQPEKNENNIKRPVGRPRTKPVPDPDAPKRPVGRPRIRPLPDPLIPKRPVGRPRTRPLQNTDIPKRPVGRPRKQQDNT
ncbi:MAG: transposase [Butyrivibrio sp.]|nr:transposase [Butyrivibrio sp.]